MFYLIEDFNKRVLWCLSLPVSRWWMHLGICPMKTATHLKTTRYNSL